MYDLLAATSLLGHTYSYHDTIFVQALGLTAAVLGQINFPRFIDESIRENASIKAALAITTLFMATNLFMLTELIGLFAFLLQF